MPELGDASARAKPQSRRSFHETMAALISAISPGSAGNRANGRGAPSADPAPVPIVSAPNFDYTPLEVRKLSETISNGAAAPPGTIGNGPATPSETISSGPKTYDIEDAIAEVTAVAAGKPIPAPPRTNSEWQPIDTGPLDRDVQVGITVEGGVLPIFFPCRRTDSGWMNAIVKAPLLHQPTCWREWPPKSGAIILSWPSARSARRAGT